METVQRPSRTQNAAARGRRLALSFPARRAYALALIGVALCVWCWCFCFVFGTFNARLGEHGDYGGDFTMFISGAAATAQGRNPYDHTVLLQVERHFLHARGLTLRLSRPEKVRVGYPPPVFWAMQPLLRVPFQPLGIAWMIAMYALTGLGFFLLLRFMRWRHWLLPSLVFLLLPQAIKGAAYGNLTGLVLAGIGASLVLSRRNAYLAGALLNVLWLKPQVGCAIFLLIVLFHVRERLKFAVGFVIGSAAWVALTVVVLGGPSLDLWIRGLMSYYHDVAQQEYLPSLVELYDSWAPMQLRLLLSGTCILIALAATVAVALLGRSGRIRVSPFTVSGLWFLWFVATPYVHLYDEVFLAIPVLLCLGHDGHRLVHPVATFGVAILAFTWLPLAWIPSEAGAMMLALALLNRGLLPALRSSEVLLAALCCAWIGYAYLPAHGQVASLLVIASGLSLTSLAARKRRAPERSRLRVIAP